MEPSSRESLSLAHLLLRLRPLNRALQRATLLRAAATERLAQGGAVAERVTAEHAGMLLQDVDDLLQHRGISAGPAPLVDEELVFEASLREKARGEGFALPLDRLESELGLSAFEVEALVLCAAGEVVGDYHRLFAFVGDGAVSAWPTVELLCALTASSFAERMQRRGLLGPHGRLRRCGVLVAAEGDGLLQRLWPSEGALSALLHGASAGHLVDPDEVELPATARPPPGLSPERLEQLSRALSRRDVRVVGVWGHRRAGLDDAVRAIAVATGRPLRRFEARDAAAATSALERAEALDALLWLDADRYLEGPATQDAALGV